MRDRRDRREFAARAARVLPAAVLADLAGTGGASRHRTAAFRGAAPPRHRVGTPDPAPAACLCAHRRVQHRTVPAAIVGRRAREPARAALPEPRDGAVRDGHDLVEQRCAGRPVGHGRGAGASASRAGQGPRRNSDRRALHHHRDRHADPGHRGAHECGVPFDQERAALAHHARELLPARQADPPR
jgi:hypothetical protein